MKIAIFTSFAINYLAKARVMADTVKALNPNIDIIALVADRFPDTIRPENEPFERIWTVEDYPQDNVKSWIFRHNIMELATAMKGWGLQRLLGMGYDFVLYLDPDCWVLDDPAKIIDILPKEKSVAVVPHTTSPADTDEEIRIIETSSLRHGIYNLGFLLVKNDANGNRLADWWAARLDKYCVDDFENGLFTDQRWFDLAVGYFDFIHVSRHAGIDVASWNVGQRKVTRRGNKYEVDGDPLIFYHFSGVGPAGVHRWVREKFAPADPLVSELEFEYEKMIEAEGQSRLVKIRPYFDTYEDGKPVAKEHRKLYRSREDLIKQFPDPYDVTGRPSFRNVAESILEFDNRDSVRPTLRRVSNSRSRDEHAKQLFDPHHYRSVANLPETDPDKLWKHYLANAWSANERPNRFFDPIYYAQFLDDEVTTNFASPLHHYLQVGLDEGLSPNWTYDDGFYLTNYPEVAEAVRSEKLTCGFEHFVRFGWKEGRSGCAFFNESAYLARHPDVAEAIEAGHMLSAEQHFMDHGAKEGRAA